MKVILYKGEIFIKRNLSLISVSRQFVLFFLIKKGDKCKKVKSKCDVFMQNPPEIIKNSSSTFARALASLPSVPKRNAIYAQLF